MQRSMWAMRAHNKKDRSRLQAIAHLNSCWMCDARKARGNAGVRAWTQEMPGGRHRVVLQGASIISLAAASRITAAEELRFYGCALNA